MKVVFTFRSGVLLLMAMFALRGVWAAMTMKQLVQSMDMMRSICAPKFPNLSTEMLDGLRTGVFVENRDLKCYMFCIAQSAGTITKKKELNAEKTINQLEMMLAGEMKEKAIAAVITCKDVQNNYKDPCDKMYYTTKCARDLHPKDFMFP